MWNVDMWRKMKEKLTSFGSFLVMYLNKTKSVELKDELYVWSDFNGKAASEEGKKNVHN